MSRHVVLAGAVAGALVTIAACISSGNTDCNIPAGTTIAVGRTNPTGDCGSDVTAGVALVAQTFPLQKPALCGKAHFALTVTFTQQSNGATCMGSDAVAFDNLQMDGGSGTDVMTITCPGVSCTETYAVTFTPQ